MKKKQAIFVVADPGHDLKSVYSGGVFSVRYDLEIVTSKRFRARGPALLKLFHEQPKRARPFEKLDGLTDKNRDPFTLEILEENAFVRDISLKPGEDMRCAFEVDGDIGPRSKDGIDFVLKRRLQRLGEDGEVVGTFESMIGGITFLP